MTGAIPDGLVLRPIDNDARDGRYQLVFRLGREFALVRWSDDGWVYSNGEQLDFTPTDYRVTAA